MDISQNKKMESHYTSLNCFLMVCIRHLVWLGILLLHRLALEYKKTHKFSTSISRHDYSPRIFYKFSTQSLVKHKGLEKENQPIGNKK